MLTQSEPMDLEVAAAAVLSGAQSTPRRRGADAIAKKAAPDAFDEVFAALDVGQNHFDNVTTMSLRQVPAINPQPFRSVSDQLDRQRERLARLLREIEGGASI